MMTQLEDEYVFALKKCNALEKENGELRCELESARERIKYLEDQNEIAVLRIRRLNALTNKATEQRDSYARALNDLRYRKGW